MRNKVKGASPFEVSLPVFLDNFAMEAYRDLDLYYNHVYSHVSLWILLTGCDLPMTIGPED